MLERWKQSKAGEGQLVVLSGEAGIGKSRLTRGMIDAVSAEAHIRVSYQCSPYHSDSPLYPVIQQLTFAARIAPDDDNDDKLDRLEKVLVGAESDRPLLAGCRPESGWNSVWRFLRVARKYLFRRPGQLADRWVLWRASANRRPCAC
jgi:hypothetical protein